MPITDYGKGHMVMKPIYIIQIPHSRGRQSISLPTCWYCYRHISRGPSESALPIKGNAGKAESQVEVGPEAFSIRWHAAAALARLACILLSTSGELFSKF